MDEAALYEEDIHAWSQHQARLLRDLAQAGFHLPNDLDLEHVAEEIEALGNEQRFQVESNLTQALIHLIKMVALPEDQALRHWAKEVNAFLEAAADRYRPSMRQAIGLEGLWAKACRRAAKAFALDGHAVPPMPCDCPFSLEDLLDDAADPLDLRARLAAVTVRPGQPSGG